MHEALECRRLLSGYTLSVLANFDMASGINPQGGVIMDPAGNLYGTTGAGGGLGNGTVFELPRGASVITPLDSFNATNTGSNSQGNLIMDAGGNLYGTTAGGGSNNVGTVFELAKNNGLIATLVNFNTSDGASPFGGLVADSAGNLYGTTVSGGSASNGAVFEVAQGSGTVTTLASALPDSKGLVSQLIMDSVGNLYGTTMQGGVNADGSIFELAKGSSTFTTLASFNATDGTAPETGLIVDAAGNLYGTTVDGGANSDGVVFELSKGSGVINTLATFTATNGARPLSTLLMDGAGNLYGTTGNGGDANGDGTVFKVVNGSGVITTLAMFNATDGSQPAGALGMDAAGNIYGATSNGGTNGGTIFKLSLATGPATNLVFGTPLVTTAGTLSPVINVAVEDSGGNIVAGNSSTVTLALTSGPSGATLGGAASAITVNGIASFTDLTLNEASTYTVTASDPILTTPTSAGFTVTSGSSGYGLATLAQFNGANGSDPQGGLLLDSAGNLFGTASRGGDANGDGTVFEVPQGSGAITALANFNLGTSGADPQGGPLVADAFGDLFGATGTGGSALDGTVVELSKGSNIINALNSFNTSMNGGSPHNALILDSIGDLYGTFKTGGANGDGAIYVLIDGSINILATFNGTNGTAPQAGLITDAAGDLFGTTRYGGANNVGTVFELALGSQTGITTLASFATIDGTQPLSQLMMDGAGNLYGTTSAGGANGDGTVFEITEGSGVITTLATFNGTNGKNPVFGPLFMDAAGNLFGSTASGGAHLDGTLFEIANGTGVITTLYSFNVSDGGDPVGGLIPDAAGNLYGTAANGGDANGDGTVFELSPGTAMLPAPATQLAFTAPPATTVAGVTLSPPVTVNVENASGNVVATDNSGVTLSIESGPVGSILGGTVSAMAVNGLATFSNLSLNEAGNYTLKATDGTLAPAMSILFTVTPPPVAPATQLAFAIPPSPANVGAILSPAVTVSVEDASGNVVVADASTVTLTIASGTAGATLGGTVSAVAVNGVATFSNLSLNDAGTYTLTASDGMLTPVTSASFTIMTPAPLPASQLAFTALPATAVAGAVISPAVAVGVDDARGNVVSTDTSAVTLSIATGPAGAVLGGAITAAAVNGVATFSNLTFSLPGDYTLQAADGTLTPATSTPVTTFAPAKIGALDPTFGFGGLASHNVGLTSSAGLVVEGDGKSIIAGTTGAAGAESFGVTRYNADGTLDTTFGINGVATTPFAGDAQATAEILLSNGDILIAGTNTTLVNGQATGSQFALVEYTSAGVLDPTFGSGAGYVLTSFSSTAGMLSSDVAHALAVGPDGMIYLGGSSDANGGGSDFAVAAYTSTGAPSPSFGTNGKLLLDFIGGNDSIAALAFSAKDELLAAGSATDPSSGVSSVALAEFLPSGALDAKFGAKGKIVASVGGVADAASALTIDAKGKIVVGGYSGIGSASAGTLSADFLLLRYASTGKLDKTFGHGGIVTTSFNQPAAITSLLIDPDGTIVASGKTASSLSALNPSNLDLALARYTIKGQLDTTFNGTGKAIFSLASAPMPQSLTTSGRQIEQPAFLQSESLIPFDATSDLMAAFMQLTQSDQGVIAMTSGGELLDVGNSGNNTVEAAIVAEGLDLTASLVAALPQSVVGGGKGTTTVTVGEAGTALAAGTFTVELFASANPYVATGQIPFQSFLEKVKLREGANKSLKLKFAYPSSLSDGHYYIITTVSTGLARDLNVANNTSVSASSVLIAKPFVQLKGSALTAPTFNGAKPVSVSFTLTNAGNITASATSAVQFFASTTATPTGATSLATVPLHLNLKPSATHAYKAKLALPSTLPAGTYMLVALIDPANIFKDPNAAMNFIVSGNTFVLP